MSSSIIMAEMPGLCVDLNNCSSILEIANALRTSNSGRGFGNCGTLHDTNFKNVVGNPNIGNYSGAVCDLKGYGDDYIFIEVTALDVTNNDRDLAQKYLWISGTYREHPNQSAWVRISRV